MVERGFQQPHRCVSRHPTRKIETQARRTRAALALVQTISKGFCNMANDSDQIGFFAAEALEKTAERQPLKTAIIAKEEQLTFGELNRRVQALAAHLSAEGVQAGERVGILLPNSVAIPLSYYATQKIGAVSVVLDARLRGKELEGVMRDADLRLFIVHKQLLSEVEDILRLLPSISVWIVNGDDDRSFEKRLSASASQVNSNT